MNTDECGECGKPAVADYFEDVDVTEQSSPMPLCEEHIETHITQRIGTRIVFRDDTPSVTLREPGESHLETDTGSVGSWGTRPWQAFLGKVRRSSRASGCPAVQGATE